MKEAVRAIVLESGRLALGNGELGDDTDLHEAGMTSHASVNVMLALESRFHIEFPEHMLRRGVFESISSIAAAIQELKAEASGQEA